ncbi:hypothetical protein LY78DRAFT_280876 [Colletotrichum sublineola]|nr:hypothetical protein LY78DRAFT_280876 [Colletotrichum sublineola]
MAPWAWSHGMCTGLWPAEPSCVANNIFKKMPFCLTSEELYCNLETRRIPSKMSTCTNPKRVANPYVVSLLLSPSGQSLNQPGSKRTISSLAIADAALRG